MRAPTDLPKLEDRRLLTHKGIRSEGLEVIVLRSSAKPKVPDNTRGLVFPA
ncbi:MAG: hypothetical protein AAF927_34110 [Bacteroidota bacterium]